MDIDTAHLSQLQDEMEIMTSKLAKGNYVLFDDDCGVCTFFSFWIKRILPHRLEIIPMHIPELENEGLYQVGDDYWKSFHVVKNGKWTTEGEAILALSSLFPVGSFLKQVARFPPIYRFLNYFLKQMQYQRKMECKI